MIRLKTMRAVTSAIKSLDHYKGNRPRSKTDGLLLNEFLRKVFEHNHLSKPSERLTDKQIQQLVATEFAHVPDMANRYSSEKDYVPMWRGQFNRGEFHRSCTYPHNFIAFRVLDDGRYVRTKSLRNPLTLSELLQEYHKYDIPVPKQVLSEVKGYWK